VDCIAIKLAPICVLGIVLCHGGDTSRQEQDEIEKASDALWQLLLGMLDKATLTLGDNRRVDLSQTMIFLTSNLGGRKITEMMTDRIGFVQPGRKPDDGLNGKLERTALGAARRRFAPEFMNRLDKVVVFQSLQPMHLEQILEIELVIVQKRIMDTAREKFLFRVTPPARDFLLREGTDLKYGARHLKRPRCWCCWRQECGGAFDRHCT